MGDLIPVLLQRHPEYVIGVRRMRYGVEDVDSFLEEEIGAEAPVPLKKTKSN